MRGRQLRPPSAAACSRASCSSAGLQAARRASGDARSAGLVLLDLGVGQVRRRASGTRGAPSACARPWRASASPRRDDAGRDAARSSTRSRARRAASAIAVGPARLGRLRQRDEQRRLGQRQPRRLLAEIGERGRAHALEVAAEGREPQVERAGSRPWRSAARAAARAAIWRSLPAPRALVLALEQARHLHGQRRAAGDDAAVARRAASRRAPMRQRSRRRRCARKRLSSKAISMAR